MVDLPERIGRYRVDGVVGSGGFATVYRAYDERFDATVAVKVLAENHCLDPDVRERFLKEGRVLRRVGSPHLVTAHDLGENDRGQPYLVLDFADRGTLAERVRACRADADPTVEGLPGGAVRVEVAQDDRTVAIVGPREVTVGATTTFAAETDGVDRSLWIGPDGGVHVDVAQIEVTAESPGLATITLIGIDGQGQRVEVSHDVHVVE